MDPSPSGGAFLYRSVTATGLLQNWAAGRYRVDVLVDGGIRRFGFTLPNRFEIWVPCSLLRIAKAELRGLLEQPKGRIRIARFKFTHRALGDVALHALTFAVMRVQTSRQFLRVCFIFGFK